MAREAMDSVGVDIALINSRQEVCEYFVDRYPDRFAACPYWDNLTPDPDNRVAGYRTQPGILAPRVLLMDFPSENANEEFQSRRLEPLFSAAEKHHLPLFVMAMGLAPSGSCGEATSPGFAAHGEQTDGHPGRNGSVSTATASPSCATPRKSQNRTRPSSSRELPGVSWTGPKAPSPNPGPREPATGETAPLWVPYGQGDRLIVQPDR
jgi:hypothetical protein